jgi:hypothetical protein
MILVSLFISLTVAFALITLAVSEVLLSGPPVETQAVRPMPLPRARFIELELDADSGVFMVT